MIPATEPLALAQSAAETLMVDECVIRRPGEGRVFDPDTGQYVDAPSAVIYQGPCQVKPGGAFPIIVGGDERVLHRPIVKVPASAVGIRPDDQVEVVSATHDVDLENVIMPVVEAPAGTYISARRLVCELVR